MICFPKIYCLPPKITVIFRIVDGKNYILLRSKNNCFAFLSLEPKVKLYCKDTKRNHYSKMDNLKSYISYTIYILDVNY